jgi:hypothetical protein
MKFDFARTVAAGVAFAAAGFPQVQNPAPRRVFEVASIKPDNSGPPTGAWTSPIASAQLDARRSG